MSNKEKIMRRTVDMPESFWGFLSAKAEREAEEGERPSVNRLLRQAVIKTYGTELIEFRQQRATSAAA